MVSPAFWAAFAGSAPSGLDTGGAVRGGAAVAAVDGRLEEDVAEVGFGTGVSSGQDFAAVVHVAT